ncbi:hypothetical protein ACCS60_27900 [Rhizobium acaciae]|uniref:hypothetical protein n=1 Tax=Rhizobium acaciae TaxID=2989736 RepID=UPI003F9D2439
MPDKSSLQPADLAKIIEDASEHLNGLTKDELLKTVEALQQSNVDIERLIRLSKLAAKAAEINTFRPNAPMAYHY